jgi:hypothetical protein
VSVAELGVMSLHEGSTTVSQRRSGFSPGKARRAGPTFYYPL